MKVVCGSLIFTGCSSPTPSNKISSIYLCIVCNRICKEKRKRGMQLLLKDQ